MGSRLDLDHALAEIIGTDHLYFQPPETVKMKYPCIVYERNKANTIFANNDPYRFRISYSVTIIDRNPDSIFIEKVAALPMCVFDRHFKFDNLNHDVFTIFI